MHPVRAVQVYRKRAGLMARRALHDLAGMSLHLDGSLVVIGDQISRCRLHRPFGMGTAVAALAKDAGMVVPAEAIENSLAGDQVFGKSAGRRRDGSGRSVAGSVGLEESDTV